MSTRSCKTVDCSLNRVGGYGKCLFCIRYVPGRRDAQGRPSCRAGHDVGGTGRECFACSTRPACLWVLEFEAAQ